MAKHQKSVEEKYRKLSDIEHVLLRPGMYIGNIEPHEANTWLYDESTKKMGFFEAIWNPGLQKMFDEIISNSVDESKRDGSKIDTIRVEVSQETGEISVYDNGGIPVVIHKEHDMYVPTMLFAELKAGSNFDDSDTRTWTGTNGVGASLVNIFSKYFKVETCDGKNFFRQEFSDNNHQRSEPKIRANDKNHTKITFLPDYQRLGLEGLDDANYMKIVKRVVDVAACNPNLKVYLNGDRIHLRSFKDYIELYTEEYEFEELPGGWKLGIAHSDDGFQHVSFVNGAETAVGGAHVDYLALQLGEKLREVIKKKYKVDVKPSEIRQHFTLFIDSTVVNPKYDSQTKEKLISELPKDVRDGCEVSEKFVRKVMQSHIIQSILDWVAAKAAANEMAELRKANKETDKTNLKKVKKFHDATEKIRSKTFLFLCEGDSAMASVLGARDPKVHACFPMRGRPVNVSAAPLSKVRENEEFENIRTLIGLKYGEPADVMAMNFGHIVVTSDADEFGNSIAGLTINMFYRLWPEIIKAGKLYRLVTPVVLVEYKKQHLEFFTEQEFHEWREKHEGERYDYSFLKGLGSSDPKLFKTYLGNLEKYMVQFTYKDEDAEVLDLCFLKESGFSDKRKEWLGLEG